MKKVYILGAGGQARETYQVFCDNGWARVVKGFIVTIQQHSPTIDGLQIFGLDKLEEVCEKSELLCAVGNPFKRKTWVSQLDKKRCKYTSVTSRSALLGRNIKYKDGTVICAGCVLTCDIEIGKHALININSTLSHDVKIEDFVTISPGVSIGGRVEIGEGTFIGIGSTIMQDIKIGKNCFIGAGAVVVNDISDDMLVYGVPAVEIRKMTKLDWNRMI